MIAIKTDGGPDRNPQFTSVKLAYTALALVLGIPKLVLMRTAAGQSFTNPVERCMSLVNLGLQGIATSRALCEPDTEAKLKNCGSMKDIRIALEAADSGSAEGQGIHTQRFAESMKHAVETVREALRYLEWSGKRVILTDTDVSAEMAELVSKLKEVDSSFNANLHTNKDGLQSCTALAEFMLQHTKSSLYVFQFLQDPPAKQPVLPLADAVDDQGTPQQQQQLTQQHAVTWLPAPVPVAKLAPGLQATANALVKAGSSGTYAPFAVVKMYAPDWSHAPSGNGKQTRAAAEKAAKRKMSPAINIRELVICQECSRPRAVHCTITLKKLQAQLPEDTSATYVQEQLDIVRNDDCVYVCGSALFPAEHSLCKWVTCNTALSCAEPMETTLYSIGTTVAVKLGWGKNMCSACGTDTVDSERRKEQGCLRGAPRDWTAYPLCERCEAAGLPPAMHKPTRLRAVRAARSQKRKRAEPQQESDSSSNMSDGGETSGDGAGPSNSTPAGRNNSSEERT